MSDSKQLYEGKINETREEREALIEIMTSLSKKHTSAIEEAQHMKFLEMKIASEFASQEQEQAYENLLLENAHAKSAFNAGTFHTVLSILNLAYDILNYDALSDDIDCAKCYLRSITKDLDAEVRGFLVECPEHFSKSKK